MGLHRYLASGQNRELLLPSSGRRHGMSFSVVETNPLAREVEATVP